MVIAVDVMGFENEISHAIKACVDFAKNKNELKIILVGKKKLISQHIKEDKQFQIVNANSIITMGQNPISARNQTDSSMYVAIKLVKDNIADGVLSAGDTASYVFLTYLLLGKLEAVSKVAFMPYMPTRNEIGVNFLDVGANKVCDEFDLVNFAKMGFIYAKLIRKINNPTVGILNIGTEENKGLDYLIKAHQILKKQKQINYVGFIEPREILEGKTNVIVTDGFVGNITLKAIEGSFKTAFYSLKDTAKKPVFGWLWFLLSIPNLLKIKKKYDYKNNAGALVIGLNKIAVKTHGSADYLQFKSSLRLLSETLKTDLILNLKKELDHEK